MSLRARHVWLIILAPSLTVTPAVTAAQNIVAEQVPEVIERLSDRLPDIRQELDDLAVAPESAGWLRDDVADVQADLDSILDEVIALIIDDAYRETRRRLLEMDDRISELDVRIDELRIDAIDAPASPEQLGLVDRALGRDVMPGSREAIAREIENLVSEKLELEDQHQTMIEDFRLELIQSYGLTFSLDECRALLYQINGSSIVEASITYSVIRQIEERLAQIRETTQSDEILRRYYGLAAALRIVNVRLHERHLLQYETDWLPSLDALAEEHEQLMSETRTSVAEESDPGRINAYQNNLDIQEQISEVIEEYRGILAARQSLVADRLVMARRDAELAVNTLRTLETASILFDQFSWSTSEYQALMDLDSSALIPLDQGEIDENYLDLSRRLTGS